MPVAARTRHGARPQTRPAAGRARRVSGPMRPAPAGPAVRRGTTGVFERIRALPETRFVDGLLRGRAWIWLIGVLLGGIVAMQVSLLKLNAGISRAVTTAGTLERQNADLEAQIARLSSSERIRATALEEGMVIPSAGEVEFLRARPQRDPSRAARRYTAPSETAIAIMLNGGREPGVLAETAPVTTTPEVPDPAAATAEQAVVDPAALTTEPATAPIEPVE
jgi:cell division protein FtsL